jgi:hypothetical protein
MIRLIIIGKPADISAKLAEYQRLNIVKNGPPIKEKGNG